MNFSQLNVKLGITKLAFAIFVAASKQYNLQQMGNFLQQFWNCNLILEEDLLGEKRYKGNAIETGLRERERSAQSLIRDYVQCGWWWGQFYFTHAPKTCKNFIEHCRSSYYEAVIFHRIQKVCLSTYRKYTKLEAKRSPQIWISTSHNLPKVLSIDYMEQQKSPNLQWQRKWDECFSLLSFLVFNQCRVETHPLMRS